MNQILSAIAAAIVGTIIFTACGGELRQTAEDTVKGEPAPWELLDEGESPAPAVAAAPDTTRAFMAVEGDTARPQPAPTQGDTVTAPPMTAQTRSRFRSLGNLGELFNDSNKYQYAAGERIGIRPITGLGEAYFTRRPLVKVRTCRWYNIDPLTHSMPYLVPEAANLLETIGRNFADSLRSHNAEGHKFRVTSVLRTSGSVKRLRRINRNATDSSTHQLGTTFDISYARFDHDGDRPRVSDEQLKLILAEVLRDLRASGRCMVKYERKSPCFHITAVK